MSQDEQAMLSIGVVPEKCWPVINPMLCKTYDPKKHKVSYGSWLEPKLDGLRGLVVRDEEDAAVFSRLGNRFWNCERIVEWILRLPYRNYVLDGEFFLDDGSTSWNTTMSVLRRQEPHPEAARLTYRVFDMVLLESWCSGRDHRPQQERRQLLEEMFPLPYGCIIPTERIPVANHQDVMAGFQALLLRGHEGGVLKDPNTQYVLGTRSKGWLKIKPWISLDLPIIGATKGEPGKYEHTLGRVDVEGDCLINNHLVHLKTGIGSFSIDDAERDRLWTMHQRGELVGKIAEFKIQNMTIEEAGRHGVFYRLREDR